MSQYQYEYTEDKIEIVENLNYFVKENIKTIKCEFSKLIKSETINDDNYKIILAIISNVHELEYFHDLQSELSGMESNHRIKKFLEDNAWLEL